MHDRLSRENASGMTSGVNPSPFYLELTGVGQLGLELSVCQLGGLQLAVETLQLLLQLPDLQMSIISLHSQH